MAVKKSGPNRNDTSWSRKTQASSAGYRHDKTAGAPIKGLRRCVGDHVLNERICRCGEYFTPAKLGQHHCPTCADHLRSLGLHGHRDGMNPSGNGTVTRKGD